MASSRDEQTRETDAEARLTCKEMIREMKMFLEPVRTFEANINSSECSFTANTLKKVFCWIFAGDAAEKEWEEIIKGIHPDIIQLKRRLADTLSTSLTDASAASLINTLPGCSVNIQDATSTVVCPKSGQVDKDNHCFSSENSDENPVIGDILKTEKLKIPTKQTQAVMHEQTSTSDELVEATNAASANLAKASRELMKIVKDPYEKKMQDSDTDTDDFTVTNRNKSRWLAPQKNAAELRWTSCSEVSEDDDNNTKQLQPIKKKRKRRCWTTEETDWIREGVRVHGVGNWSAILMSYPFVERTNVDIKDKHRNMLRNFEM